MKQLEVTTQMFCQSINCSFGTKFRLKDIMITRNLTKRRFAWFPFFRKDEIYLYAMENSRAFYYAIDSHETGILTQEPLEGYSIFDMPTTISTIGKLSSPYYELPVLVTVSTVDNASYYEDDVYLLYLRIP